MESHKRLLSILHIIYGSLHILLFVIISMIVNTVLPFALAEIQEESREGAMIAGMVFSVVKSVFYVLLILIPIPSIVGGIALINGKKWGLSLLLISGSLSLLSIPIGTALGVYTLWVFLERDKKKSND